MTGESVLWEGTERKKGFTEKPVNLVLNKRKLGLPSSTSRDMEVLFKWIQSLRGQGYSLVARHSSSTCKAVGLILSFAVEMIMIIIMKI